jgi:hypothetical protein
MRLKKSAAAVALGKLGGKAGTGKSKVRNVTSEQMRAAVNARWSKYRAAKPTPRAPAAPTGTNRPG